MNSATRLLESSFLHGVLGMHREREREREKKKKKKKRNPRGGENMWIYIYGKKVRRRNDVRVRILFDK